MIQRAIFGDVKGAHNLVIASPGIPNSVTSELAWRYTDRILPTEISWQPYLCGFPLEDYYVVTRTFPVNASRPGMVQTHAVLLPLHRAVRFALLWNILNLLPHQSVLADAITLEMVEPIPVELLSEGSSPHMPRGYPSVVRALFEGRVPVWLGDDNFEAIVCSLWFRLWPEARQGFRFRVSAGPNDLAESPATILYAPFSLRMQWSARFLIDQSVTELPNPSRAEAYLLGLSSGESLGEARARLDVPLPSVLGLQRIEQYVRMLETDTEDGLRAAARILGVIAPDPDIATTEKTKIIALLAAKTRMGSEPGVLGLRNFDMKPFATGRQILEKALTDWIIVRIKHGGGGELVVEEAFLKPNPWEQMAQAAICAAFSPWTNKCASLLWVWWRLKPDLVRPLTAVLPEASHVEDDLIISSPAAINSSLQDSLLALARDRDWNRLHAIVLSVAATYTVTERFQRQLAADKQARNDAGLHVLVARTASRDLISAALQLRVESLLRIAGHAAYSDPLLMDQLNVADPAWRIIWLNRIDLGGGAFDGVTDPKRAVYELMDQLLAGVVIAPELLNSVADEADLSEYPRRKDVWKALLPSVIGRIRAVTAKGWLKSFFLDVAFDDSIEMELSNAVITEWRAHPSSSTPEEVIRLWQKFGSILTEDDFVSWLSQIPSFVSPLYALTLGNLVREQHWRNAAARLLDYTLAGRSDLTLSVQECTELLGFWDRAKVALLMKKAVLSDDEWWQGLYDVCVSLYSSGIDDNNIWESSAGDKSRVKGDTGRERWASALWLLRQGGAGKKITVEGFLYEMREDFQNNEELKLLEDVYKDQFNKRKG